MRAGHSRIWTLCVETLYGLRLPQVRAVWVGASYLGPMCRENDGLDLGLLGLTGHAAIGVDMVASTIDFHVDAKCCGWQFLSGPRCAGYSSGGSECDWPMWGGSLAVAGADLAEFVRSLFRMRASHGSIFPASFPLLPFPPPVKEMAVDPAAPTSFRVRLSLWLSARKCPPHIHKTLSPRTFGTFNIAPTEALSLPTQISEASYSISSESISSRTPCTTSMGMKLSHTAHRWDVRCAATSSTVCLIFLRTTFFRRLFLLFLPLL